MEIKQKKVIRSLFVVKEKIFLTPHYIRIVFGISARQAEQLRKVSIGGNNKIFVPAAGAVIDPMDEQVWDTGVFTAKRTYTTRYIDFDSQTMWVDFAAHGDNGPASAWALRAVPGDVLGIGMKESSKPLVPAAVEYLLAGDITALPVIGAILEQLPPYVKVNAVIEVPGQADEMELYTRAHCHITWLHNPHPQNGSTLAQTVKSMPLPQGNRYVFMAAEYNTVRQLRQYLKEEQGWNTSEFSATAYWQSGATEDQSSASRQAERS
ncbi:siderophore-interacting protein [Chitinophaga solisilvae]|uniref:Siderophore-interacting protein n=1 Tax=Chitinophaga solisilvae TaxID=1233460 RepID=A0A3S1D5N8_9BACT|nr:siderophore-interacting protein [Chitinophaga solisilvae]NSL86053.1 siderophore-interacting protein [Chitinophaga solisilvae]